MPPEVKTTDNLEIEQALIEFQNKESQTLVTKEPNLNKGGSKMVLSLIKHSGGIIKDKRQAEYFLLGFAALAFLVSIFLFFRGSQTATPPMDANSFDQLQFTQ